MKRKPIRRGSKRSCDAAGYDWKVVNAGISGETSSGTLSRINWVMKLKPDIVILETGANDGLRGIDPRLTRKNIDETIRILKQQNVTVVLVGMQMVRNLGQEFTQDVCRHLSQPGKEARPDPGPLLFTGRGRRPVPEPVRRHPSHGGGLPHHNGKRLPLCKEGDRQEQEKQIEAAIPHHPLPHRLKLLILFFG